MGMRIKMVEKNATVTKEIPGEYVTAGDTYQITYREDRRGDVHFWNTRKQAGTSMRGCQFASAVKSGAIVVVA